MSLSPTQCSYPTVPIRRTDETATQTKATQPKKLSAEKYAVFSQEKPADKTAFDRYSRALISVARTSNFAEQRLKELNCISNQIRRGNTPWGTEKRFNVRTDSERLRGGGCGSSRAVIPVDPILTAVMSNDIDLTTEFLTEDPAAATKTCGIAQQQNTLLHLAQSAEMTTLLLDRGADPNAKRQFLNHYKEVRTHFNNETPLGSAHNAAVIRTLLAREDIQLNGENGTNPPLNGLLGKLYVRMVEKNESTSDEFAQAVIEVAARMTNPSQIFSGQDVPVMFKSIIHELAKSKGAEQNKIKEFLRFVKDECNVQFNTQFRDLLGKKQLYQELRQAISFATSSVQKDADYDKNSAYKFVSEELVPLPEPSEAITQLRTVRSGMMGAISSKQHERLKELIRYSLESQATGSRTAEGSKNGRSQLDRLIELINRAPAKSKEVTYTKGELIDAVYVALSNRPHKVVLTLGNGNAESGNIELVEAFIGVAEKGIEGKIDDTDQMVYLAFALK